MTKAADSPNIGAEHVTSANGPASLTDRVRGLRLQDRLDGSKSRGGASTWLPWLLCLIMAVTWASFAIRAYTTGGMKAMFGGAPSSASNASANSTADAPKKERPAIADVTAGPDGILMEPKGNLVAAHQIQVSPIEISGRIMKLFIEEGKFFKKDTILATIDDTFFKADYEEATHYLDAAEERLRELNNGARKEEIEQAKAQLAEAKSLRDQYERDYARYEDIRKRDSNVAQKEYDTAKFAFETQKTRVTQMESMLALVIEGPRIERKKAAAAEVRQARARLARAKWRLDNCTIKAPIDGIILSRRAEVGNLVNALSMNAQLNGGICEMADLTDLEVDLEIQERDIRKVFVGQECAVRADAYPERRYAARVDRIMPVANSSKAVIPIRVKVRVPRKEEGIYLKPQMGAVVTFYNRKAGPEPAEPPEPTVDK